MKSINNQLKPILLIGFAMLCLQVSAQKSPVNQSELPQKAQTFLKKHFKNETVSYAVKDRESFNRTEYEVHLGGNIEIEFDGEGNWKEVKNENNGSLPTSFIPNSINRYIRSHFPNTAVTKIEKSRASYEVELINDIELVFDSKGKFLRMDD